MSDQIIAYPYIEGQQNIDHYPIELQRFCKAIEAMHDGEEDELLKRMVEQVPIKFIQKNLSKLEWDKPTSARARENVSKLLARIRQFRELDETTAPALIFQARDREKVDTLCVCIFALPRASFQAFAADALRTNGDPQSARCLLIKLYETAGRAGINMESNGQLDRLRRSLAKAFGDVSQIDISDFDGSNEDIADLKEIIQQGEVWLEEYEKAQSGE